MVVSIEHIKPNGRYTVIQAAEALGVSRGTIYNWARNGYILFRHGKTKKRTIKGSQLIKYFNKCS